MNICISFNPKLLIITFNEIFEINNLMNQIWIKRIELQLHESFYEVNKKKCVCYFDLFWPSSWTYVYVFMSVTNE